MSRYGRWFAALAGVALPLAFAPFHWWYLAPLLLAVLFASWRGQHPVEAARRGFLFGACAFGAGTYWIYISVHIFGGAPPWLAIILMIGLVLAMALYLGACGWLVTRFAGDDGWRAWCVAWPAAWVLIEWLRGWLFTGFPWLSLGYAQVDGPLAAFAPVGGVYGVSLLVAMLAGAFVTIACARGRARWPAVPVMLLAALLSAALSGRQWALPEREFLDVHLVQGSISQDQKWRPEQLRPTLELYRELTLGIEKTDLVVWPEAAVPAVARTVRGYLDDMRNTARTRGFSLLLGILTYDPRAGTYSNTLMSLGSESGIYRKRHLVPFGEFFPVPAFIRSWMRLMSLPYADTAHGPRDQPPLIGAGIAMAPSICYEDAFGAEQLDFLPEAGLLVNVSNDAWFGDSIAPHQHLQIARMRAVESGRYMLRATNTGITAIIAPDGRVSGRLPQFESGVLAGEVTAYRGATPYVRGGNTPVVIVCLLLFGSVMAISRRR